MDELLSIGRFARLSGLSIGALRHYDELDLLRPADIDRFTGYRRYRRDQLDAARTIAGLRDLEVPLDEIREILGTDDPAGRRRLIAAHRARIEARMFRLQRVHHTLGHLSDGKEPIVTDHAPATDQLDPATERRIAVRLFNRVWELLEMPDRTPAQVDEMIHSAHASRHHWSRVGEAVNLDRGEWQCSRVYAVLGRTEPALWHARRTLEICQAEGIGDWDLAFAYEALARASAVAGNRGDVERYVEAARAAAAEIAEDEDRQLLLNDLETIG